MKLSAQAIEEIDRLIPRYPEKRSAMLMVLHEVQTDLGYISAEAMEWVAEKLDVEPINVYEVVTFYPMFKQQAPGRKQVKVCRTLSCALRGSYTVCEKLKEKLGCELGGVSQDGEYGIEFVECIASCGTAPVVQVNEDLYENVSVDRVDDFVKVLQGETVEPEFECKG